MPVIGTQGALTFIKLGAGPNYNAWFFTSNKSSDSFTSFRGSVFDSNENLYLIGNGRRPSLDPFIWLKINIDKSGFNPPNIAWQTTTANNNNTSDNGYRFDYPANLVLDNSGNIFSARSRNQSNAWLIVSSLDKNTGQYLSPTVNDLGDRGKTVNGMVLNNNVATTSGFIDLGNTQPNTKFIITQYNTTDNQIITRKMYGNTANTTGLNTLTAGGIKNIGNTFTCFTNAPHDGIIFNVDNNISNINWQKEITQGNVRLQPFDMGSDGGNIYITATSGVTSDTFFVKVDNSGNILYNKKFTYTGNTSPFAFYKVCNDTFNISNTYTVGKNEGIANSAFPIINFDSSTGNINWQRNISFSPISPNNIAWYFDCSNINITSNNMVLSGAMVFGQGGTRYSTAIQLPKNGFLPGNGVYNLSIENLTFRMHYTEANLTFSNANLSTNNLSFSLMNSGTSTSNVTATSSNAIGNLTFTTLA